MVSFLRMDTVMPYPKSWLCTAWALNDAPLIMRYTQLDRNGKYRIRVVYSDIEPETKIRLVSNEHTVIHPLIKKPEPVEPMEFDVPEEATASGKLELRWYRETGLGGNGRGCQVSEV